MKHAAKSRALNVVFALAWLSLLCGIVSSCRSRIASITPVEPKGHLVWASDSGTPAPGEFVVLLIPKKGAVMKSTDGGSDQPMVRAVHSDLREYRSGVVALTCSKRAFEVPSESLTLATPGTESDRLIAALVAEGRSRKGATNQFSVQLRVDAATPDAVTLKVRSSEGMTERYTYRVTQSEPVPLRWDGYNRMGEVLETTRPGWVRIWIIHAVTAVVVTMGVVVFVGRRMASTDPLLEPRNDAACH